MNNYVPSKENRWSILNLNGNEPFVHILDIHRVRAKYLEGSLSDTIYKLEESIHRSERAELVQCPDPLVWDGSKCVNPTPGK